MPSRQAPETSRQGRPKEPAISYISGDMARLVGCPKRPLAVNWRSCSSQPGPRTAAGGSTCCGAVIVVTRGSGSRVGRGWPSPPGEDGHHREGSDRQDDDPHAVRDGAPGRTTGADPREHEPKNQAHAQVASTSVFADALTLPAMEAGQRHSTVSATRSPPGAVTLGTATLWP
jgi:hypothetical protein